MTLFRRLLLVSTTAILFAAGSARAQYPYISSDVKHESDARRAAADQRSDEAWAKALPVVQEWATKGKPYIPGAAEPKDLPQAAIPAFPGAMGGGMHSFGGRGGRVYVVTSLEDRGPGTFREALEAGGPRIVVFNVSGIIRLKERIRVRAPYITIDGSSAPGDGVCIAGDTVELETHDVVIRHMRFRRGETWVGDRNDSLGGNPIGNIMIDHVSASWGLDENMSMYRHMYRAPGSKEEQKLPTVNITIQNSIFSEGLNTYHHAFGGTIGGLNSTFYNNLFACNTGRNPSVGMIGDFTFVNNVLFNWRHRTIDGGDQRSIFTIVNNYFKPGPATPKDEPIACRILKPESERSKTVVDNFGKAYVAGNVVEGNEKVTADNWDGGVQPASKASVETILPKIRLDKPFSHAYLEIRPAKAAYQYVLANAGATLPHRDPVDARVTQSVRTGEVKTSKPGDLHEKLSGLRYSDKTIEELAALVEKGIITDPKQVGGYPEYRGQPYKDSDGDGMPDAWETKHGLNPNDASDASAEAGVGGYSNIECFLYGIHPTGPRTDWDDAKNNVDRRNQPVS
ncbi:polysaccharide lyase [Opitutaceae bacterium EW11]|nr:polysaccharide lyase [Opitutaceae bacterium EW11]